MCKKYSQYPRSAPQSDIASVSFFQCGDKENKFCHYGGNHLWFKKMEMEKEQIYARKI